MVKEGSAFSPFIPAFDFRAVVNLIRREHGITGSNYLLDRMISRLINRLGSGSALNHTRAEEGRRGEGEEGMEVAAVVLKAVVVVLVKKEDHLLIQTAAISSCIRSEVTNVVVTRPRRRGNGDDCT
ncbi:hypothetical protein E2C01_002013 [Portunus trituberculatus]|uniref:Uncharacterized protein n=1 Tax=Portunus trituberculatus TaxID=210409 RepID=A0A5B7CI88_PORTR|nr:hypothetical protein [Portunus trituberculatus]